MYTTVERLDLKHKLLTSLHKITLNSITYQHLKQIIQAYSIHTLDTEVVTPEVALIVREKLSHHILVIPTLGRDIMKELWLVFDPLLINKPVQAFEITEWALVRWLLAYLTYPTLRLLSPEMAHNVKYLHNIVHVYVNHTLFPNEDIEKIARKWNLNVEPTTSFVPLLPTLVTLIWKWVFNEKVSLSTLDSAYRKGPLPVVCKYFDRWANECLRVSQQYHSLFLTPILLQQLVTHLSHSKKGIQTTQVWQDSIVSSFKV